MACDFKRMRHINQLPHSVLIHRAIDIQDAEHNAICSKLFCDQDIALHNTEFIGAVAEISATRPDHYMQANCNLLAHRGNHSCTGCGAAFRKASTEFNAVSAAAL